MSIICATYNGSQKLPGLLEAIESNLEISKFDCELIFVIDGSTDYSNEILQNFAKSHEKQEIKILENVSNFGISQSRNIGIATSKGEILAFLDDDCRPNSDWINTLGGFWAYAPESTVGVGGFVVPSEVDSFNQRFCAVTKPLRPYPLHTTELSVYERIKNYYAKPREGFKSAEYLVGANMSFRKTALHEVAFFPPEIRFGGDDSYICQSLRQRFGNDCLTVLPSLVMPHEFPRAFRDTLRRSYKYGQGAGKNFWRGEGGFSFNPGPLLICVSFVVFLAACEAGGISVENFSPITSIALLMVIFSYSLFVTGGTAPQRLRLIERPKFGLAFLLCELANTLGFFSTSLIAINSRRKLK
jgi:hypothetical protein